MNTTDNTITTLDDMYNFLEEHKLETRIYDDIRSRPNVVIVHI